MKKLFSKKLWEILSIIFASVFVLILGLNHAGSIMEGQINEMLGLRSYIEVDEGDGTEDANYFPQLYNADNIEDYYRQVNVDVQGEGTVLLKNENNALPLEDGGNISLVLSGSANLFYASHGPGVRLASGLVDLKTAIEEETDLTVNPELYSWYQGEGKSGRGRIMQGTNTYYVTREKGWSSYPSAVRNSFAQYGDAAIAVITRESGEGTDVSATGSDGIDGSYLSLTAEEREVLEQVKAMKDSGTIKKIIVLINSAVTLQCDFLFDEALGIDAAMWIGLPGGTGTRAVAQALVGEINPSGRLSDTFLKDNFAAPAAAYWLLNEGFSSSYANSAEMSLNLSQQYYGVYLENIYVGYRYFETRYEDYVTQRSNVGRFDYQSQVAYPFGYGLSYTTFEYSNFAVSDPNPQSPTGDITVTVNVQNTGEVAGKEVVQIYLQKPYTEYDQSFGIEKASVELVGFAKTAELQPNADETVTISISKEKFKSYDAEIAKTYILDAGDYYLTAAKHSHDAINNILALKKENGDRSVNSSYMTDEGNADLAKVAYVQDMLDSITYSTSTEAAAEGAKIENRLDFMDPNRYEGVTNTASDDGNVTYVSRYNWQGTYPSERLALALTADGEVKYDITSHKPIVEDEDAEMPTYGADNGLTLAMMRGLDYDDEQWEALLDMITEDEMWLFLTGCYGYTPEIPSIAKPLTDEDDGPYGVSNCEDGYSSMSCAGIIASTFNTDLYGKIGEAFAADARSGYGGQQKLLNGLYSPGINIHRCAFGGRAAEYFSEDPVLSGIAAIYQINKMQEQGVVAHPKHYIFNDEETNRNGISIWSNEQSARELYLLPWEYALRPSMGNSHAIMTSFNRAGCIWTSASSDLMMGILRDEWAFDGYALTDMADSNGGLFMTYDDGFMNGTSCFLSRGTDPWDADWRSSPTFNSRLRDAAHRMLYVFANYSSALNGYSSTTRIIPILVWWQILLITLIVVFAVLTVGSIAMYVVSDLKNRKNKNAHINR